MKRLGLDVSSFLVMRKNDYLYIDKTRNIHTLINIGRHLFLSRPRRFGKSLLVSTLKHLFQSDRDLFKGLWIDASDYSWEKYPVIHFDLSGIIEPSTPSLHEYIRWVINESAQRYNIDITGAHTLGTQFIKLVQELSKINKVVILVDEYDHPLLRSLDNLELAQEKRKILKGLFATFKSLDEYVRFVFITGISTFSKTSIFSGGNNLNDVSLHKDTATLLGYTGDEIANNFDPYIKACAAASSRTSEEIKHEMTDWYNGYCFSRKALDETVHNPFSIQYYLSNQERKNYWFASGTPTFLVALIQSAAKKADEDGGAHVNLDGEHRIDELERVKLSEDDMEAFDLTSLPLKPILFQSGYLTIKGYDGTLEQYILGFPNQEVKLSFIKYLVLHLYKIERTLFESIRLHMRHALQSGSLEDFIAQLNSFFNQIPYHLYKNREAFYQAIFFFATRMSGFETIVEQPTSLGRIDAVIDLGHHIYLFEFKIDAPAEEALAQIKEKGYVKHFAHRQCPLILIGLHFDTTTRQISEWKHQVHTRK